MTDKELLKLAAKAVGFNVKASAENSDDFFIGLIIGPKNTKVANLWNPLKDDGDALRLAADLDIHIKTVSNSGFSSAGYAVNDIRMDYMHEHHNTDKHAATRRAIVRAAAAIGAEL